MKRALRPLCWIVVFASACSAGGDDGTTDGVVQETNLPCTPATCACDLPFFYTETVVRTCNGLAAQLSICSDVAVCDAARGKVASEVAACAEPDSPFSIDTSVCDD